MSIAPEAISRAGVIVIDPSSVVPFSNISNFFPMAFDAIHSSSLLSHLTDTFSLVRTGNRPAASLSILNVLASAIIESG